MEKKGEITTTMIVITVLAVLGFAIVLYFLFSLDLSGLTTDEVCHLSVITRATLPSSVQNIVPLNCGTKKICITNNIFGGKCDGQFAGESNVEVVRLFGKSAEEKRRVIEQVSANAMYDCWNIMGQGKLDIFGNFYTANQLTPSDASCVICSRVAIDTSIPDSVLYDASGGVNVNNYLATQKVPGKDITYLQAFTDKGIGAYANIPGGFTGGADKRVEFNYLSNMSLTEGEKERLHDLETALAAGEGDVNRELSFVFMQIRTTKVKTSSEILASIGASGATAAGATFMTPVVGGVGSSLYAGLAGLIVGSGKEIYGAFNAQESQISAAGYCGAFASTEEQAVEGCSVVQGVNYKFAAINKMCKKIEGNP